jgi:hypothetical protein
VKRVGLSPLFRAKGRWYDPFVTGLGTIVFALAGCFIGWQLVAASHAGARTAALALAALAILLGVVLGAYVGTELRQAQAPHERTRATLIAALAAAAMGLLCWGSFAARHKPGLSLSSNISRL